MSLLLALTLPAEKAKTVAKLLLKLGATSAQADMNHFTVFHYVVANGQEDVLNLLLTDDKPVALSVLNNIASRSYGQMANTPLTTAIESGNQELVARLLRLGAQPVLSFDDWVKTYLAHNSWAKNQTNEQTRHQYQNSVVQPIIAAAINNLGKTVQDLIAHGASPDTLEKSAYSVVQTPQNGTYTVAESVLDIVQKKLKALRE